MAATQSCYSSPIAYMATKISCQRKTLGRAALKVKKLARPDFTGITAIASNQISDETVGDLACAVHSSINDRQKVFPGQKMAGQAKVGIEELRCTGGAGETTTPDRRRQVEVVAGGPTD
jgi:hypothetical protein